MHKLAMIGALERAARSLEQEADQLHKMHDYSAEIPSEDARAIREAITIVEAHYASQEGPAGRDQDRPGEPAT